MRRTRKSLLDAANVALIPLRPLSIGEILDGAFLIVQRNVRSLLGLPLVVVFILCVLTGVSYLLTWVLGDVASPIALIVLIVLETMILGVTSAGAMVWVSALQTRSAIVTVMGDGFAPPSPMTLRQALRFIGPVLAMAVLFVAFASIAQGATSMVSLLVSMLMLVMPTAQDPLTASLMGVVVLAVSIFVTGWVYSWVSVALPVYMAEGKAAPDWVGKGSRPINVVMAFARSFVLVGLRNSVRGALVWMATFSLLLLCMFFVYIGALAIALLFVRSLGIQVLTDPTAVLMLNVLMATGMIVALIATLSLGLAYVSAVQTLFYLDLRMRREGLDLALRFTDVPVPDSAGKA